MLDALLLEPLFGKTLLLDALLLKTLFRKTLLLDARLLDALLLDAREAISLLLHSSGADPLLFDGGGANPLLFDGGGADPLLLGSANPLLLERGTADPLLLGTLELTTTNVITSDAILLDGGAGLAFTFAIPLSRATAVGGDEAGAVGAVALVVKCDLQGLFLRDRFKVDVVSEKRQHDSAGAALASGEDHDVKGADGGSAGFDSDDAGGGGIGGVDSEEREDQGRDHEPGRRKVSVPAATTGERRTGRQIQGAAHGTDPKGGGRWSPLSDLWRPIPYTAIQKAVGRVAIRRSSRRSVLTGHEAPGMSRPEIGASPLFGAAQLP